MVKRFAQPMKDAAVPGYNLVAGMFWTIFVPGLGAAFCI